MLDFYYHAPTAVYFGRGKQREIGGIIKGYGYKKIMMQYGKGSVKASGLYDEVMRSLKESGISVVEAGGVEPNPKLSFIRNAAAVARKEKVELILAVGGGSVIDSCKFTALAAVNDCDVWDFPTGKAVPVGALPVGCILTHAAAGSEMSSSAVMTNEELHVKKGFGSEYNRCKFAVMNPELTFTVSKYQTACGVADIMAHTMERYFTVCPPTPLTDEISEALLRSVISAGKTAVERPNDYEARAEVMWASSLSHNGLTDCGREGFLAVHQLEHAVSGLFDRVPHGAGLAVLYPAWARFEYKANVQRFARFARKVWGAENSDDEKAAAEGIDSMAKYFSSIGLPSRLGEFGITEEDIERLALHCSQNKTRTVKSFIPMGYSEMKEIFSACM